LVRRFSQRVQALAANHDLLVRNQWRGIDVSSLVRVQLAHFEDLVGQRILLKGDPLRVASTAAQSIAMAIHELATNAAKHGALSDQNGHVNIDWDVLQKSGGDDRFTISWVEHGGPAVTAPARRGFGSRVIKEMAELSLDGDVEFDYAPSGLTWRLTCPMTKILADSTAS
jgi:two-component sensor histidine kinase